MAPGAAGGEQDTPSDPESASAASPAAIRSPIAPTPIRSPILTVAYSRRQDPVPSRRCRSLLPRMSAEGGGSGRALAVAVRYWERLLELDPMLATLVGDDRYDDRLPDTTEEGVARAEPA